MTTDVREGAPTVPAPRRPLENNAGTPQVVWRLRLVTALLLIGALMFRQAPGQIVADTKLDLTADPGAFLRRALTLWDGSQFGQLQNQAYGYLWPMGAFHWLLHEAGTPAWIIQRLWWTLVLGTAFLGMWRLSTALGAGGPWTRYLGALLFALSPRFQGEITVTSIEVWPMAVAPWVLAPLVDRRALATRVRLGQSAMAVACVGGVNAVATGAVLILPALWFMTRRPSWAVVRQAGAWLVLCSGAILWWLIPLLMMGRYSPPFLDWIEAASNTTTVTSPFSALQGTATWAGWLVGPAGGVWPGYRQIIDSPLLMATTAGVWILGLLGIMHPRCRERRFLAVAVVAGVALVTLGFHRVPAAAGPFAEPLRHLLDGPLAPLRNIHKFELVVRVPIILGLIHCSTTVGAAARGLPSITRALVTSFLIMATCAPAVAAALPAAGGYQQLPTYWREAAMWLDKEPTPGTTLVVPAQPFSDFTWGTTRDHPFQALAHRPFAVRDIVPLGSAGATRLLDGMNNALRSGRGSATLVTQLRAAGVAHLLVSNDARHQTGQEPLAIHQALAQSGLRRVASFGPPAGSPIETSSTTLNQRTLLHYPSLEIFAVGGDTGARVVDLSAVTTGVGGPEDAQRMAAAAAADTTVLVPDALPRRTPAIQVLTDGLLRREAGFGIGNGETSAVLSPRETGLQDRPVHDYRPSGIGAQTARQWQGAESVTSSSSASDVTAQRYLGAAHGPAAAFDADPSTRWISDVKESHPELRVTFAQPVRVAGGTASFSAPTPNEPKPASVRTITDSGERVVRVRPGRSIHLTVAPGPTRNLRIRLESVRRTGPSRGFAINEVSLTGNPITSALRLTTPTAVPQIVRLQSTDPGTDGCYFVGTRPLCASSLQRQAEETSLRRLVRLPAAADYTVEGTALSRPGTGIAALLDLPGRVQVRASSTGVAAAAARPASIVDRDLGTGWSAALGDRHPRLDITLPRARRLTGLQIIRDRYLAASMPTSVQVTMGNRSGNYPVSAQGYIRFPSTLTRTVTLQIQDSSPLTSISTDSNTRTVLPPGMSELRLLGADDLRVGLNPATPVRTPCGFGPDLRVDNRRLTTRVSGTVDQVLRRQPLSWTVCGTAGRTPVRLTAAEHLIAGAPSAEFVPASLTLTQRDLKWPAHRAPSRALRDTLPAADQGRYDIPAHGASQVLVINQNFNPGWRATTADGTKLEPVRLDGWKQGFILPASSAATITTGFVPQTFYRWGLGAGVVALIVLILVVRRGSGHPDRPVRRRGRLAPNLSTGALTMCTAGALIAATGWTGVAGVSFALFVNGLHGVGLLPQRMSPLLLAASIPLTTAAIWASCTTPDGALTSPGIQIAAIGGLAVAVIASLRPTPRSFPTEVSR